MQTHLKKYTVTYRLINSRSDPKQVVFEMTKDSKGLTVEQALKKDWGKLLSTQGGLRHILSIDKIKPLKAKKKSPRKA